MRIAIASYGQETSSFSPVPTTLDTFRLYGLFEGGEILDKCRGVGSVGGFLENMDQAVEWTPLPVVHGAVLKESSGERMDNAGFSGVVEKI